MAELSVYSGHENLEVLSENHRFNNWIYEQICPGLKGDVLEIGSGIGTFSEKIIYDLSSKSSITLSDISSYYVNKLEERFLPINNKNNHNMKSNSDHIYSKNISVCKLDLNSKEDYERIGYEKFDSVIAINVLEHVEDDEFAFQQLYNMLRKGGILIVLVPCHKFLYNVIDKHIGHFRRYTKRELESKVKQTPFTIGRIYYFNMLGIIGWYVNGTLAHKPQISGTASQAFDRLVPLSKYIEKITCQKIGLSIICYLSKK
jgi:SAM-dependent methyltransferase